MLGKGKKKHLVITDHSQETLVITFDEESYAFIYTVKGTVSETLSHRVIILNHIEAEKAFSFYRETRKEKELNDEN